MHVIWPQIVMIILLAMEVAFSIAKREGLLNTIFGVSIYLLILYWGGFWDKLF